MNPCALYVAPDGPYPALLGAEFCWTEDRDARTYNLTRPVIAHPPCSSWGRMARVNHSRWGTEIGDDAGAFRHALETVRECGGVLEHPSQSIAFEAFGLGHPSHGVWSQISGREWTCCVWQSAYGHVARKATWLLYSGDREPFPLRWQRPEGTKTVGGGIHTGFNRKPRASDSEALLTPHDFAVELVRLARWSRIGVLEHANMVAGVIDIVRDSTCTACKSIAALERDGVIERGDAVCKRHPQTFTVSREPYRGGVL